MLEITGLSLMINSLGREGSQVGFLHVELEVLEG